MGHGSFRNTRYLCKSLSSAAFIPSSVCIATEARTTGRATRRLWAGDQTPSILNQSDEEVSVRENIEYLCGIGGVSPSATGATETQFGSVVFKHDGATAIVSLLPFGSAEGPRSLSVVLGNLEMAAGLLQRAGGCCDSFTFLSLNSSTVELHRANLQFIRRIHGRVDVLKTLQIPASTRSLYLQHFFPRVREASCSLEAQFLTVAFLSYAQAHCGPIRPCFLDTPVRRIILIGDREWSDQYQGPCIVGSLVELSCFG